ncbi:hypothetical protein [Yoonia sp. BS5-3]|uniref:RimK family alpha-L-glutamate ligase n=1 Tax=Yoonia phaeophyticola TaxID=3137369 RepID=A0ABZ2V459_9RHOB
MAVKPRILAVGSALDPTFVHFCVSATWFGAEIQIVDAAYRSVLHKTDTVDETVELVGTTMENEYACFLRPKTVGSDFETTQSSQTIYKQVSSFFTSSAERTIINSLEAGSSNFCKLQHTSVHLDLCHSFEIQSPETILSNCPDRVREFSARHIHGVILKGASNQKSEAVLFDASIVPNNLLPTPILLQEYIEGYDVRVHQVGHQSIGERIRSDDVDYRFSKRNSYELFSPPPKICEFCFDAIEQNGLLFGGIDFKVRDGKYYFLEVNSLPDYRGYDKRSNFLITREIVDLFVRNAAA